MRDAKPLRLPWPVLVLIGALASSVVAGVRTYRNGSLQRLLGGGNPELTAQLRDRASVALAGTMPWRFSPGDTPVEPVARHPALDTALRGRDEDAVAAAYQRDHFDGLLVRAGAQGDAGSVLRALSTFQAPSRFTGVYVDDTAALYEPRDAMEIDPADARRLITVARLVLSGAVAPPERIFPETLRRTRPVEVAMFLRDGREPILWRSTRGGSIARAFLDVCFAVLDRWTSRQQERYGRLRDGLRTLTLTVAVFYDKGVLGARTPEFLRRAADPRVWAVGYERLATWEYSLPPSPWRPATDPSVALRTLAAERGVSAPWHLRPELTLYRFRALQMVEQTPSGEVTLFDPR